VDLGVGQIATLLAKDNEVLEPRLARLDFLKRELDLAQLDALLAAASLAFAERRFRALDGELRCDLAGAGLHGVARNRRGRSAERSLRFCSTHHARLWQRLGRHL